jgi:hypothetical protein
MFDISTEFLFKKKISNETYFKKEKFSYKRTFQNSDHKTPKRKMSQRKKALSKMYLIVFPSKTLEAEYGTFSKSA